MYVCVCVYIETTFFNNTTHESLARMANRTVAREPAGKSYAQCREMLVPPTPTLRRLIVTHVLVARRVHVLVARRQVRFLRHCGCVCAMSPARCSSCKAGSGHRQCSSCENHSRHKVEPSSEPKQIRIHACMCVCIRTCMCKCMYVYVYIYRNNVFQPQHITRTSGQQSNVPGTRGQELCTSSVPAWLAGRKKENVGRTNTAGPRRNDEV